MARSNFALFTLVAILYLIIIYVAHYFYEEYLWFRSVESYIPGLQGSKWWVWKRFVFFISLFGWEIMWLCVIVFFCKFNRASSSFVFEFGTTMVWFVSMMKMAYNDPAPYMDRDNIDAFECDHNTFQTPSLEVTMASFMYSVMFYLAFDWIDVERPRVRMTKGAGSEDQLIFEDQEPEWFLSDGSEYKAQRSDDFKFWIWLTLLIYLVFLISYAAMYNGVNSLDQVLFGMWLGYGLFCLVYFYMKDVWWENLALSSEKMMPYSKVLGMHVAHLVVCVLMAVGAKILYSYQIKSFTVNPTWKAQHRDDCGKLPYPSFFDKELLIAYRFTLLNYGIALGYVLDSVILGGTRIDYNQVRASEGQSPAVSFIIRFCITLFWIILNIGPVQMLINLIVHSWFILHAIPYFTMGLGIYGLLKYPFHLLGATRPEIYPIPAMSAVGLRKADRPFE